MMHFCSCGSFECICDGKCICARRYCLCTSCHDLRRKDWCKVCGLPSSYRELSACTAVADVCKCSSLTSVSTLPNRFGCLDVSSEVLTEDVQTSESPCVKEDYENQEQHPIPSILTRWPMEQEMLRVLEFGKAQIPPGKKMKAEGLSKFSVHNTERSVYSTNVDSSNSKFSFPGLTTATESSPMSSLQGSSIHEQQELFQATSLTEQMLFLTDKGKLFSSEGVHPTQSPNFCVRRCGSRNSKDNPSETSLDSDFSFLEMPENKWNSDFSIIEIPGDDTNPRINSYFTGDLTSTVRTSSLPSEQTDKPHPCFSSLPTIHVNSGSSISRSVPSVPRSSVISPLGHIPHLPSSNSQLSKSRNIPPNRTSCASVSLTAVTSVQATSSLSGDTLTTKSFHPLAESRRVYKGHLTPPLKPIHSPESQDMSQTVETERQLSENATAVESPKVVVKSPELLHGASTDKEL